MVATSLDGLWEWDYESNSFHCTDRCVELLGYKPGEIPPSMDFFWNSLHPEDADSFRTAVGHCVEGGTRADIEHRLRTKEGEYRWFRTRGQAQRCAAGQVIAIAGVLQDITSRKHAEFALKDSECRFRTLCEASMVGVYIVQNGCYAYVNPALARILGRELGELNGLSPLTVVHPEDSAVVEENMRRRLSGELETSQYEVRVSVQGRHHRPRGALGIAN